MHSRPLNPLRAGNSAAALVLLALLAACAGQPTGSTGNLDWPDHHQQIKQLQHWNASGKAALRRDGAVDTASLLWRQREGHSELRLTGPLGAGATTLRAQGGLLSIDANGEHSVIDLAQNPGQLVAETGWDLPIAALSYWLRGIPAPDAPDPLVETDPQRGYAMRIVQSSWAIDYARYATFDGYYLPTRITLANGSQKLTVLLRNWQVDGLP